MPSSKKKRLNPPPVGVLLSGGLDSAVLTQWLRQRNHTVWPVYVRCGLPWEKAEIFWTRRFLKSLKDPKIKELKVLSLSLEEAYDSHWARKGRVPGHRSSDASVFLPGRNLLLMTKSILYLSSKKVDTLALALLRGNPFPDATNKFFRQYGRLLSESFRRPISVLRPFRNKTKTAILKWADPRALQFSFSCINPRDNRHCGKCNKCAERKKAFRLAAQEDITPYRN